MKKEKAKQEKKARAKTRSRFKIFGTSLRPRLTVFKSNTSMFLQIINDEKGLTLASAHSKELNKKIAKTEMSFELGKLIAKKALENKIDKVVFDRSGNVYHGRVEAAAKGAREGGLNF